MFLIFQEGDNCPFPQAVCNLKADKFTETQKKGEAERQSLDCIASYQTEGSLFSQPAVSSRVEVKPFRKPAKVGHHMPPRMFLTLSEIHKHTCAEVMCFSLLLIQRASWQASVCALRFPGIR